MKIISLDEIKKCLNLNEAIAAIEHCFEVYSRGNVLSAPVSRFHFDSVNADLHIKSGMFNGSKYFVVKIAGGFYDNEQFGLPTSQGMMIVLDSRNGTPVALIQDEGYLTDLRTAIAGLICAKLLAPCHHTKVLGIFGAGTQGYLQAKLLKHYFPEIKNLFLWGRNKERLEQKKPKFENLGFSVTITTDAKTVAQECNLIVTTTPSTKPILFGAWLKPGTHITALGADDPHKQELDMSVFQRADYIVVDSKQQCLEFGDRHHALASGIIGAERLVEIGALISNPSSFVRSLNDITIADLTGLAAQDIAIANYILENYYVKGD